MSKLLNVYCDESRHLLCNSDNIMVLGAIYCHAEEVKIVSDRIRNIKKKHKLKSDFETKWTKVSPSKIDYYLDLIDYFFKESPLRFRTILIPDKSKLDHKRFKQTHDDWYYKMYYVLLKWIVRTSNKYHFYLDIKDTRGSKKIKQLEIYLANNFYDFSRECIARVQQIRSHESELLQLADLLIGAVSYANWSKNPFSSKSKIVKKIESYLPQNSLTQKTLYAYGKFNIFVWDAC
jgi:Protein of unknown function (DUF3800)